MGRLLGRLLRDESVLYAITRQWRYDARGRKFFRLHALLDEQFAEIGVRLVKLAARIPAPGPRASAGHLERIRPIRPLINDGALESHMLRELLALHEAMLVHLQSGKTMAITQLYHVATVRSTNGSDRRARERCIYAPSPALGGSKYRGMKDRPCSDSSPGDFRGQALASAIVLRDCSLRAEMSHPTRRACRTLMRTQAINWRRPAGRTGAHAVS
jgi:DNA-binding ferritin-like protein